MHTLYTVGYQGKKVALLKDVAVKLDAVIVDARFSPNSRVPEWSGKRLREFLGERYVHVKELGNKNYKGGEIDFLDLNGGALIVGKILEIRPAILMCACWDLQRCHRLPASKHISQQLGCELIHLESNDQLKEIVGVNTESSKESVADEPAQIKLL